MSDKVIHKLAQYKVKTLQIGKEIFIFSWPKWPPSKRCHYIVARRHSNFLSIKTFDELMPEKTSYSTHFLPPAENRQLDRPSWSCKKLLKFLRLKLHFYITFKLLWRFNIFWHLWYLAHFMINFSNFSNFISRIYRTQKNTLRHTVDSIWWWENLPVAKTASHRKSHNNSYIPYKAFLSR